jgi:hypothetical protein
MISEHLFAELQQLKRIEKLQVIQWLVNQITQEEAILSGSEYEVWSPHDTPETASILMEMLAQDRQGRE